MKTYTTLINQLKLLKLSGILANMDEMLSDFERQDLSTLNILTILFQKEVEHRCKRRLERNLSAAHFPSLKRIEDFDFGRIKGIGKTEAANFMECSWIDRGENLLLFGPPGLGKTHLSIGFGLNAIEKGYSVCFEKITSLIKLLKLMEIQKAAEHRIKKILKANVVIIDEIGYTPIEKREANLFFNLISELHEKASIVITSNKSFDKWEEMMGDTVLTTALLDRLLHNARIFNLDGDSYRMQGLVKN